MKYEPGQRVIFTKRGERRYYDTEWPGVYVKLTPSGRHSVRLDGQRRVIVIRDENNLRPAQGKGGNCECGAPLELRCPSCNPSNF